MNRVPISRDLMPATSKQLWRIRRDAKIKDTGQLAGRLQEKLESPEQLTRGQASDIIEAMIQLPTVAAAEQLPDGSFKRVEDEPEKLLEEGVYVVSPWDRPAVLVRVARSRRTGRMNAIELRLDWRTGSHVDSLLGTVKGLLEGESELGPVRAPRPLPLEEVVAFADLSGWCLVCAKRANDLGCTHV